MRRFLPPLFLLASSIFCSVLCAQDFGFGFDEEETGSAIEAGESSLLPFPLETGGEIEAGLKLFVNDFKGEDKAEAVSAADILSAKINFSVAGKNSDFFLGLNLSSAAFSELKNGGPGPAETARLLDEAWLRGYFGTFSVEAGLIKLGWGKMYSPGPLDIVNPLDYSDLTNITDFKKMKIARPMIHISWNAGDFSKLESVFIPNFQGHRFAQSGRWVPEQFSGMNGVAAEGILDRSWEKYPALAPLLESMLPQMQAGFSDSALQLPDTSRLDYFQTGLRFTGTAGPVDFGLQYFYGNMFRPSFYINGVDNFLADLASNAPPYTGDAQLLSPHIEYSRYHQLGLDYAQVLFGFNLRAEFALHLTGDTDGDDGAVQNPFIAWSLGFDRDIIWGVNFNIQCNESVRLLDDKVLENPALDSEGGSEATATRIILQISKQFFRDKLECKVVNIWDIEEKGGYIIPSLAWSDGDIRAELSAGIFAGDNKGELGQYRGNSFIKAGIKYSF